MLYAFSIKYLDTVAFAHLMRYFQLCFLYVNFLTYLRSILHCYYVESFMFANVLSQLELNNFI